jgi:hypothetical protein
MKVFLLLIYLYSQPDTTKCEEQTLIATFTDVIKKENVLYLQFTDSQKKQWLFNALKSETLPYVFYTTESNGNIIVNPAIRNHRFKINYQKIISGGRNENWIIQIKEL